MFRKLLDEGRAGDNIGALLRGTKREEIERGQVLAKPGQHHAAQELQGRGLHPEEGGGRPSHAVLQGVPAAVLLPHDGRDGPGDAARGRRRWSCRATTSTWRSSSSRRSRARKVCASRSARAARPSAPASSPRSSRTTQGRQEVRSRQSQGVSIMAAQTRHHHPRMHRLSGAQLHDDEEQARQRGEARAVEVLLPAAASTRTTRKRSSRTTRNQAVHASGHPAREYLGQ